MPSSCSRKSTPKRSPSISRRHPPELPGKLQGSRAPRSDRYRLCCWINGGVR
jgi:hypothetical protein